MQYPVLGLERVQVQQCDRLFGAVAVEALDGYPVTLDLISVVPVAVNYQPRSDRLSHFSQHLLDLKRCPLMGRTPETIAEPFDLFPIPTSLCPDSHQRFLAGTRP